MGYIIFILHTLLIAVLFLILGFKIGRDYERDFPKKRKEAKS